MVVAVTTSNGGPFYVDAELVDTPLTYTWTDGATSVFSVSDYTWYWVECKGMKYPTAKRWVSGRRRTVRVHRLLAQAPPEMHVDHVNGDTSNNALTNLRFAKPVQNSANRKKFCHSKQPFKGIESNGKGKFRGRISHRGRRWSSSWICSAEEAARWYDAQARELHGEFARLNFPREAAANG